MNVLFFSPYFFPHISGITKSSKELLSHLVKKHAVTALSFSFSKGLKKTEIINGIKVVRMPFWIKLSKGFISPQSLVYFWKFMRQADLVIVDLPNVEGLFLVLLARIFGKKVWSIFHCQIFFSKGLINYFLKLLVNTFTYLQLLLSNSIFVFSWDYFKSFKKYRVFENKTQEVLPVFKQVEVDKRFKQKILKEKGKEKWVGFVGRVSKEKGLEVLIEAVRNLPKNYKLILAGPELKKIVGEEKYIEKIKIRLSIIKSRYKFYPDLSDSGLKSLLSVLDALVLPSLTHTEAFGIVQLEAMSVGTPVIVSDMPGVRVPIKLTGLGRVFPVGDSNELKKSIKLVIKNKKLIDVKKVKDIYKKTIGNFSFYDFFDEKISEL